MRLRGERKIIFLVLGVALLASFGRFSQRDFDAKKGLQTSVLVHSDDPAMGNASEIQVSPDLRKESCKESFQQEKIGLIQMEAKMEEKPTYLYKVLSLDGWAKSSETVHLSSMDAKFIHLSTEDQLDKIVEKYWAGVSEYVILKIETDKLPGKLVLEANPGGTNKYYHLYNGSIPLNAIVESEIKNG